MKSKKLLFLIATIATCLMSCDDTTDLIGGSIVDNLDNVNVKCDTFSVASGSATAGAVYSRSTTGYLGKVKDPETGSFVSGDFCTQFYTLEGTQLPEKSTIMSKLKDGRLIADSCVIYLYYDNYFGDSLSTMKVRAIEMGTPLEENKKDYNYSDFNPETLCRTDGGAVDVKKTYTLYDNAKDTVGVIRIKLPNTKLNADSTAIIGSYAYHSKDGKGYHNYGTYLMQKYFEDPKNYKNAYTFIHNVCPGFYFKSADGLGSMAYIYMSQMLIYYKYKYEKTNADGTKKDTISSVVSTFAGTEEVLQTTRINGNLGKIDLEDPTCTYVKSPAGIYTELTIPVDEVMDEHKSDTINSARLSLTRINNTNHDGHSFNYPSTLLMVQKDKLKGFFEDGKLADNKESFLATYSAADNTTSNTLANSYTFHNISNLIKYMYDTRKKKIGEEPADRSSTAWNTWNDKKNAYAVANSDWNKVYIVPVTAKYETRNNTQQLVKVQHNMGMTETRLQRGDGLVPANKNDIKLKLFVIYSKFEKK